MDGNNQPQQPLQPMPQAPAPQPPMQPPVGGPVGPIGSAPMGSPYHMPPKKGLSKGALWGIIGGSIGLILLIVGIILAVVFLGGPSKEDYKTALENIQELSREIKSEASSITAASDADDAKKKMDGLVKKMNEYVDTIGKEKALRDPEVKKIYDEMSAEYKKMAEKMSALPKLMSLQKCGYFYVNTFDTTLDEMMAEFEKETRDCAAALKDLENDSDEKVKDYVAKHNKFFDEYKEYMRKRANKDYSARLPESPGVDARMKLLGGVEESGKKVSQKEKELLKLLGKKAGVDVTIF
ncbi:MAG: hypothetical protein Q4A37_02540 [Candidatus Saccharibacteria bacterium]|nr:hypothetical protein [Candidatus Saccharibacteria bacterium]